MLNSGAQGLRIRGMGGQERDESWSKLMWPKKWFSYSACECNRIAPDCNQRWTSGGGGEGGSD